MERGLGMIGFNPLAARWSLPRVYFVASFPQIELAAASSLSSGISSAGIFLLGEWSEPAGGFPQLLFCGFSPTADDMKLLGTAMRCPAASVSWFFPAGPMI